MDRLESQTDGLNPAELDTPALPDHDPRPPLDDTPATVEWILRRYFVSRWDNDFMERLEVVLRRDQDGNLLPDGKLFRTERRGVTVTAASQDGKTTLVMQVLKRLFNDSFTDTRCGEKIVYCRLRGDATLISVYKDLCRSTGYFNFPAKLTRTDANELAMHCLRKVGIKIIVIDEVHNLIKNTEPVNLFLKTLVQDGGGFCVILIGTPKVREFIYENSDNIELAERYFDMSLERFSRDETLSLINGAIKGIARDASIKLAMSIRADPYFADRIYDGCRGSYGRCMFLIANAVVRALEEGGDSVDIEDFRRIFDLKFLHYNPENPFATSDWASRASAIMLSEETVAASIFTQDPIEKPKRKRGRPRKTAEGTS
jgi:type II secretory pathway predicted ATPase ExeA